MVADSYINTEEPIYSGKDSLNNDDLITGLKKLRISGIKKLGIKFRDNLLLVERMVALPHVLLALEHYQRSLIPYEILATIKATRQEKTFSEARKELFESKIMPKKPTRITEAVDKAEKTFLSMLEDDWWSLRPTYQALLFSGAVWIWCSFEVLMKELWEFSLNYGGNYVSKNVVSKLSSLEPRGSFDVLRGRYISLDLLAKHGYNISNKLGAALSSKFDFTSVNGIREAYTCAFPRSANTRDALDNQVIIGLEATRNVVVHNAGVIDEAFCKRMNANKSEIGKTLQLTSHKLFDYGNSSIDVGLRVMMAVSPILLHAKSLKHQK